MLLMVPYDTLPAEMTSRYDLRSEMSGARCCSRRRRPLAALILEQIMAHVADQSRHFSISASVFALLFALPWIFVWRGTGSATLFRHRQARQGLLKTLGSLYREMASTFHLRTFRIHIMMYVGGARWR